MGPQQEVPTDGRHRPRAILPEPFRCSWEWEGVRAARVGVAGELDLATAPELAHMLESAQRDARLVVLDLGALTFLAVVGIRAIIEASRRAERDGHRLVLTRGTRQVHAAFVLSGTEREVVFLDAI